MAIHCLTPRYHDVDESVPSQQGLKQSKRSKYKTNPGLSMSPFHHNKD